MSGSFDNLPRLQSLDEGEYGKISAGLRPPHSIFTLRDLTSPSIPRQKSEGIPLFSGRLIAPELLPSSAHREGRRTLDETADYLRLRNLTRGATAL